MKIEEIEKEIDFLRTDVALGRTLSPDVVFGLYDKLRGVIECNVDDIKDELREEKCLREEAEKDKESAETWSEQLEKLCLAASHALLADKMTKAERFKLSELLDTAADPDTDTLKWKLKNLRKSPT